MDAPWPSWFAGFPKVRPVLPEAFCRIYLEHHKENRQGGSMAASLSQKVEAWMHKRVAADVADAGSRSTLEIGAGTLNHLPYEPRTAPYDVVEPHPFFLETSPHLPRIRNVYGDIREIPPDRRYDRIVSIATLEHVTDLPRVVAGAGALLSEGGQFRVGIPSEGTLFWRLGWTLTTGLEFRFRHGLDYGILIRYEHVNTAAEVEAVLRVFFEEVQTRVFGLSRGISLYQACICSAPRKALCARYLAA